MTLESTHDKYRMGKFQTQPLDADAVGHETLSGVGVFEIELSVEKFVFDQAPDKRGYFIFEVSRALAELVVSSTVPPHLWLFEVDPKFVEPLNLPPVLNFGLTP